jgi:hypothetical protein
MRTKLNIFGLLVLPIVAFSFTAISQTLTVVSGSTQNPAATSAFNLVLSDPTGDFNRSCDAYNCDNSYTTTITQSGSPYAFYTSNTIGMPLSWGGGSALTFAMTEALVPTNNSAFDVQVNDAHTGGSWDCTSCFRTSNLEVTATSVDFSCNGAGSATALVTGGIGPFTYSWSNGATTVSTNPATPGAYTVAVTDGNSVTKTASVDVNGPLAVSVLGSSTDDFCAGGTATVSIDAGTPPYSYLWSDGATTSSVSGLASGVYTVDVTDGTGCVQSASATVAYVPTLVVESGSPQDLTAVTSFTLELSDPTGSVFNKSTSAYGLTNNYEITIEDCSGTVYYSDDVASGTLPNSWNGVLNLTMMEVIAPVVNSLLSVLVVDNTTSASWYCFECMTFFESNDWLGSTSADWNDGSNWWSGVVPGPIDDITIGSSSNYPQISTSAPGVICGNLTIESGASITVDAGKALTVSGNLSNEGTVLVKADATGIGSLITEGTVSGSGSFQMEQYLTGSGGATPNGLFYYVSSPVVGAMASTLNLASGNKLWSADETTQSYSQITSESTGLTPAEGYIVRMGSPGVVTYDGTTFNSGNHSSTGLTRTGTTAANRGYNLVANPYPSTVSWDDVDTTNLFGTIWYRTHQGSTMLYDTYNGVSGLGTNNNLSGAVTGDIPPTQGFWVRVKNDNTTASVNFTNAMRSHGTLSGIYRMEAEEEIIRISLGDGTASDEAILLFNQEATDDFDAHDSHKFWAAASVPQLYTTTGSDSLVINGLFSTASNPVVDLGVKLPSAGDYSFSATSITLNEDVYLEDRLLGILQYLNEEPNYDFTSTVGGNIPARFALHFGMAVTGIEDGQVMKSRVYTSNGNQLNIILSGNTEAGNVQVLDMAGRVVFVSVLNSTRNKLELNVNAGIYLVQVATATGTDTHRVILN